MSIDNIMHVAYSMIQTATFHSGVKTKNYPFEYYYCEECLYLVRHKHYTEIMMFIEASSPDEAIVSATNISDCNRQIGMYQI